MVLDYIVWPSIVFLCSWLATSQTFASLDFWQPDWYKKRCCADTKLYQPMTSKIYKKLLKTNLCNLVFSFVVFFCVVWTRYQLLGSTGIFSTWTNPARTIVEFVGCGVFAEMWFYNMHFWMHKNRPQWHTKHHEFQHCIYSMVGLHCSLQEMAIVNVPIGIGFGVLALVQSHVFAIWLGFVACQVAVNHSCHCVLPKICNDPAFHFAHHSVPNQNYGAEWVRKIFVQ